MTIKEFKAILKTTGLPAAYRFFKSEQKAPYIVFSSAGSNNISADNKVYAAFNKVRVDLYCDKKDIQTEQKIENALSDFYYEKSEDYIDSLKMIQIIYEMEI